MQPSALLHHNTTVCIYVLYFFKRSKFIFEIENKAKLIKLNIFGFNISAHVSFQPPSTIPLVNNCVTLPHSMYDVDLMKRLSRF